MEDIAPGLLEKIRALFWELLGDDKPGADTYAAAGDYAERVGGALAEAFRRHLSGDALPEGRMYWNIADRVVRPLLEEDWRFCTGAAAAVQRALNKTAGLGLTPQVPEPDKGRIDGILNRICAADRYEDQAWMLGEPVRTFSRAAVDETLRRNAEFHAKAGLRPRIVRTAEHGCCKWCSALAGVYDYPDVPDDVYKRHANCRCSVEYDPGGGKRQDVWTKRWTDGQERGILEQRKTVGLDDVPRPLRILRGSGGTLGDDGKTVRKYLGRIDPENTDLREKLVDKFCEQYASSPYENMLVITKEGDVYFMTDSNPVKVDCSNLGDKLRGSYNIHTHPPDSTQFSFSTDVDMPNFFEDGSTVMEAVDYKYRYKFEQPEGVTWEQWDKARGNAANAVNANKEKFGLTFENYEENLQHVIIEETCRLLGIQSYERKEQ